MVESTGFTSIKKTKLAPVPHAKPTQALIKRLVNAHAPHLPTLTQIQQSVIPVWINVPSVIL